MGNQVSPTVANNLNQWVNLLTKVNAAIQQNQAKLASDKQQLSNLQAQDQALLQSANQPKANISQIQASHQQNLQKQNQVRQQIAQDQQVIEQEEQEVDQIRQQEQKSNNQPKGNNTQTTTKGGVFYSPVFTNPPPATIVQPLQPTTNVTVTPPQNNPYRAGVYGGIYANGSNQYTQALYPPEPQLKNPQQYNAYYKEGTYYSELLKYARIYVNELILWIRDVKKLINETMELTEEEYVDFMRDGLDILFHVITIGVKCIDMNRWWKRLLEEMVLVENNLVQEFIMEFERIPIDYDDKIFDQIEYLKDICDY